jgi:hypothetical protein
MNEHTLPDDLSRWPSNPFKLLGVAPGVHERDLRRAYTHLIRLYKPEHFPEHFRRIREAFEAARGHAQFYPTFEAPADSPVLPVESRPRRHAPPTPEADNPSTPVVERPTSPPPPRSLEDELDEAWNWAVDGDEARAYARLLELQNRYPNRSETCIRLYSLLTVAPELDNQRISCNFLVLGLRRAGGGDPCHELYRREIEDNPDEALTDRFAELLETTTQPGLLSTFVKWRWSAAGKQERFDVIGNDLPGLRGRLATDHEEIWLRLLAFAVDQLAWAPSPSNSAGLSKCRQEIAMNKHLQLRCADVFDRLEYLERAAVGWHFLMEKCNLPADLLELLSRFWTRPFAEVRRAVTALLAAIDAEKEIWLAHLDSINEASPQLLSLFGKMLDSYQETLDRDADDRDPAELTALAQYFLKEHDRFGRYSSLRPRLLAFCLRERIDPDVIVRLAQGKPMLPYNRSNKLVKDWPLRHIYRACTLFRN